MPSSPPILRIGRQMIGQFHVVAVSLPVVRNDCQVIDAVVLQGPQVRGIALVRALMMSPDIEHDPRAEQFAIRRRRMRDVRQHFAQVRRDGHVAGLHQRVPRAVGLGLVVGHALRAIAKRGKRSSPGSGRRTRRACEGTAPGPTGTARRSSFATAPPPIRPARNETRPRFVAAGRDHQGLALDPIVPVDPQGPALRCRIPRGP